MAYTGAAAAQPDPSIISGHVSQRLRVAEIGIFDCMCKESGIEFLKSDIIKSNKSVVTSISGFPRLYATQE